MSSSFFKWKGGGQKLTGKQRWNEGEKQRDRVVHHQFEGERKILCSAEMLCHLQQLVRSNHFFFFCLWKQACDKHIKQLDPLELKQHSTVFQHLHGSIRLLSVTLWLTTVKQWKSLPTIHSCMFAWIHPSWSRSNFYFSPVANTWRWESLLFTCRQKMLMLVSKVLLICVLARG